MALWKSIERPSLSVTINLLNFHSPLEKCNEMQLFKNRKNIGKKLLRRNKNLDIVNRVFLTKSRSMNWISEGFIINP